MSTIKSSDEHLTLNADGSSKDIKFQANGVEKASISSAGAFTSTTIDATKLTGDLPAISGANLTGLSSFDPDGAVVFNESGADVDFRVEADNDTNALFIEGANGNVGVGNTATQGELSVTTGGTNVSGHTAGFQVRHNGYSGYKSGMSAGDTADTTHYCGFIGFIGGGHTGAGKREIIFETRPGTTDAACTERLRITDDGRGLSQFTAKAWLAYNGNNNTVSDSHNISSVTDNSSGNYTMNFSNNMANTTYVSTGCAPNNNDTTDGSFIMAITNNVGSCKIIAHKHNGTNNDRDKVQVITFGD